MPSLLDTLDRFSHTSSSIHSLTLSQPSRVDPGPFTAAILDLTLHDLLREADEAEYGLFSFVKDSSDTPLEGIAAQGKVGRKEFRGATPLKTKRVPHTNKDEEPEVYVEAAMKYLDRFQVIRPMPHAQSQLESLIDRLNHVRDNLDKIQASLEETTQTGRASPKSRAAEEERRITELKSRILQLRKRKEALVSKLPATSKPHPRSLKTGSHPTQATKKISSPSSAMNSPSSVMSTPTTLPKPKPNPWGSRARAPGPPSGRSILKDSNYPNPELRIHEGREATGQLFWSGGKPPRITHKSDSLLDEELDMSGMDALMSPPPAIPSSSRVPVTQGLVEDPDNPADDLSAREANTDDENDDASDSGEPTIVISKLRLEPALAAAAPPSPPPSRPLSQNSAVEPQTPVQGNKAAATTTAPPSTKTKVRRVRITADVERVCAKIWSTIPHLLVPGNNFNSPDKHPPNAKDTLAVLQTIAAQPIPDSISINPSSPSTRSTLSSLLGIETFGPAVGTPHQIMTAHVLLSLLTAPNHEIPLTALKTLLASKIPVPSPGPDAGREAKQNAAALGASAAQIGTRALYGCVAKKIVKIDRGGGEQIVKFDRM